MVPTNPSLIEIWNSFAERFELITEEVISIENDHLILVMVDTGSLQNMFDYDGHFETVLTTWGMKLWKQRNPIDTLQALEIARSDYNPQSDNYRCPGV